MTLEQLRIFVAVAEREHVTRAADALGLTQSAVSAAISSLENQHRVALFHRVGRRIELSTEGRLFLEEARGVLTRAASAERALADISGFRRGVLSVQASQTAGSYWLPERLAVFHRAYPGIAVRLTIANTAQVARAVGEGLAELGFVEGRVDDNMLEQRIVGQDHLMLIVRADHPWARLPRLRPDQLPESRWVLREVGSGTRSEFAEALSVHGLSVAQLDVALELPSNEAVRAAVEAGAGVAVLSELVARQGMRSGMLARVEFHVPSRPFYALSHQDRPMSRAASAFIAMLARAGHAAADLEAQT